MDQDQLLGAFLGQCAAQSNGVSTSVFGLLLQILLAAQCQISPPSLWPPDFGPTLETTAYPEFDFVIVGAGSSGCAVANRLSEICGWDVLLIEAGHNPTAESEIPLLLFDNQFTDNTWNYFAEKNPFASKDLVNGSYWPSGRMLGGSSGVNGMLYVRGNRRDYDGWEAMGNPTWGWRDVIRYFKKSEDMQIPEILAADGYKFHSTGGLLKVNRFGSVELMNQAIVEAAKERGYKELLDYNRDEHIGFSHAYGTTRKGRRWSSAKAFLASARNRTNLFVSKNSLGTKILLNSDSSRAVGVEFEITSGLKTQKVVVRARKEVIVSAGSVNTAKLMQLSGIGRPEQLSKFNIPVLKDLPVGYNLQDHLFVPVFFRFQKGVVPPFDLKNFTDDYYRYLTQQGGPFSTVGITETIGFVDTKNCSGEFPDIQYHFVKYDRQTPAFPTLIRSFGFAPDIADILRAENQEANLMHVFVTLLFQTVKGRVELRSRDPHDPPRIISNYLVGQEDVAACVKGIRIIRSFLGTEAFRALGVEEIHLPFEECDVLPPDSDEYWECYSRQLTSTLWHPAGTTKMGPVSDPEAVVDSRLRVHGVGGLRVMCASVMPKVVSGNTNAPSIMIGEKGADFIKEDWKQKRS